jgi:hypothetical protein
MVGVMVAVSVLAVMVAVAMVVVVIIGMVVVVLVVLVLVLLSVVVVIVEAPREFRRMGIRGDDDDGGDDDEFRLTGIGGALAFPSHMSPKGFDFYLVECFGRSFKIFLKMREKVSNDRELVMPPKCCEVIRFNMLQNASDQYSPKCKYA